jgi:hypothetical protein
MPAATELCQQLMAGIWVRIIEVWMIEVWIIEVQIIEGSDNRGFR